MQLTSKTPGLDEKLDGLLSLFMHEFEDQPAIPLEDFMIVMVNFLVKNYITCRKSFLKTD